MQAIDVINVFYGFCLGHVFYVFLTFIKFFPTFFYLKKRCQMQSINVKIQRKIFLEDDLATTFIDFGLLRIAYTATYLTYFNDEEH